MEVEMRLGWLIPILALGGMAARAQHCTGQEIDGPYVLQLAGVTAISGRQTPAVGLARLVFSDGRNVSGYTSVNFTGYLLGNPTTGAYEIAPDCTLNLNLQDDSGGYQHFRGKVASADRVELHQTDPGTGESGVLERVSGSCGETDLRGSYTFTVSGEHTPVDSAEAATPVSLKGLLRRDVKGQLSVTWNPGTAEARIVPARASVQSDCTVELEFAWPSGADTMHLRGMLAQGGGEIPAIDTDPGETISARFGAR